ncbi:MAG: MiaB/RimO family radical SAM methylthiotransferase, partial [Muribaculaceae bacterium]|nr:MiaB/RimO family radical SAM methylthiotransferase [Muribaculaceae bacterium]
PKHYTYIKIAEGCNRFCAFCAIPLITGRFTSRKKEDILEEVKMLAQRGVKEFNIIAQDLSSYGLDIYGKMALPELIDEMSNINGVKWIRLHYAYPAQFPIEILDVMARHSNVCNYLDIALQHIDDTVLSNMRRHITKQETLALINEIRQRVPGIHLRTTLMVGFPGETEKAFDDLKQFVKEVKFERMGAFAYCEEEDTYAAKHFEDSIPEEVKQRRLDELMEIQEDISLQINEAKVGKVLRVIIDREDDNYYIGRTEFDSPEVDPEVLICKDFTLEIGEFYDVKVTDALAYELIAKPISK